nr:exopolysaccharide biosynthesis protein [Aliiroseovarius sp. S1339]
MPGFITRRAIPGRKLDKALCQIEGPLGWVQDVTTRRLAFLTTPPVSYLLYTICLFCGAAMPFLELVPLTSSMLASVVALLSIALISKDGVFTLIGLTGLASTAALPATIGQLMT